MTLGKGASGLLFKGSSLLKWKKALSQLPGNENVKAEKILALILIILYFKKLQTLEIVKNLKDLLDVLYTEALILEGFQIENPVEFIKKLNNLLK